MAVRVCIGGTFNAIHDGHLALLSRAFKEGDELFVGLTSDAMAGRSRSVRVRRYKDRLAGLEAALARLSNGRPFHVFRIDDEFGPAATEDFDVIVVSEETSANAGRINLARLKAGLPQLRVVVIPMVLDITGERLSSTRTITSKPGKDNA